MTTTKLIMQKDHGLFAVAAAAAAIFFCLYYNCLIFNLAVGWFTLYILTK